MTSVLSLALVLFTFPLFAELGTPAKLPDLPPGVPTHLPDFPGNNSTPVKKPGKSSRPLIQDATPSLSFFCQDDIEKAAKLPTILLAGETHETLGAEISRLKRMAAAKGGQCHVALEGVYCDSQNQIDAILKQHDLPKGSPVYGYDDPFTHGLGVVLAQLAAISGKKDPSKEKTSFVLEFEGQEFLRKAWTRLKDKRPYTDDPSEEAIAKVIDGTLDETNAQAKGRIDALAEDHPWRTDHHAFIALLKRVARSYVEMAKADEYRKKYFVPTNLSEIVEDALTARDPSGPVKTLMVEWRNQFMAANLAALYCRALKEGKDLHVLVGSLHVPGLKAMLQTMSKGRVKVEEEDTNAEAEKMLRQLEEIQRANRPGTPAPGRLGELPDAPLSGPRTRP